MTTSRKDLLVGGAAASLASLWGCGSHAIVPLASLPNGSPQLLSDAKTDYDVIVVGAGAAGIAAARAVLAGKRSVLVLEAQDHIGGRCRTLNTFPIPFDQGAQFVGQCQSLNNFLYPLMVARGIPLVQGDKLHRYFFDPQTGRGPLKYNELLATYAQFTAAILASGLAISQGEKDVSVQEVIDDGSFQYEPYIEPVLDLQVRSVDGGDPKDQSVLDLYNNLEYLIAPFAFPPKDTFLIPTGYGAFIASLGKGIPLTPNSPVESIDYRGKLVSIRTANKRTYTAKAVIVTASVNVLKSGTLTFAPDLPRAQAKALSGLTMGHAIKLMLEFNGKPFEHAGIPPNRTTSALPLINESIPQFFLNYFKEVYSGLPHTYMMTIVEGKEAVNLEKMGPKKAGEKICAYLSHAFPGIENAWTRRILTSNWATNPYTLGCISYATTNHAEARVTLSLPVANKLFFAGEAISVHSHSLVNGAWASGTAAGYGALFAIGALTKQQFDRLRRVA